MELAAQRVIDITRKHLGDMRMADRYDEALGAALAKLSGSTPLRQQPALNSGFYEGWQAALALALRIVARRFEVCDAGLQNGLPDGVSRDYVAGSRATCMDLTVSLEEHDRVRAAREAALDRVAENARALGIETDTDGGAND